MKDLKIVGIGEVLWDLLPEGKELGGAPANFTFHAKKWGADSTIISAVGNDALGTEISSVLKDRKQSFEFNISSNPTGTVSINLKDGIPDYTIYENVAWDEILLSDKARTILKQTDAICYGSLAQRSDVSKQSINEALDLVPENALKVFDINLRQHFYSESLILESLQRANVLKLNSEELIILSDYFNLESNQEKACYQLIEQFSLQLIALTNGSENSLLITKDNLSDISTPRIKVVDTVGAGDSFTATLVVGLLQHEPVKEIHQRAVDYSAKVCMHKGATPKIKI